jgi:Asp-tRNA(Asn)/Glu-tRNA(Gln) amidotransferase C subunit
MDEKEAEKIRKEAKQILDKFGKTLEKVKFKEKEIKTQVGGFREEGQGKKGDESFRAAMFRNAPQKNEDHIVAEKKKW